MRNFVHFHTHSHYSVLDGLGRPTEMVKRAVEIGSPALAISDHGSISSMPELFRVCKEEKIKPIIGVEFYVVDDIEPNKDEKRFHLTVWAKNWNGVKSIMSKLTIANEQFYRRPRISFAQSLTFEDCCIGTACSFGILAHPNIVKLLPMFVRKYGDDFYLEMMPFNLKEQHFVNNMVLSLLKSYPFNVIATNDSHYIRKEDAKVHDALLAIQTNSSLNNPNRFKFDGDCFYMKSGDEMYEAFLKNNPYIPVEIVEKAISETVSLSEKCNIDLPEFPINLPSPYDEDDEVVFSNKIKIGWGNKQKYIEKFKTHSTEEYLNRVMFEIDVIKKKGFIRYFLVVEDMITWARNNGIMVGPARGSAAGSLVCWLMGITQVDPLRWDLYFERFLDVEREDYPDIDIDFQDDQRQRVFDYVRLKYGYDKTAQITTFGFLKPKSAFRDVCRVYDKDMATVNHLSKKIEDVSAFEEDPEVSAFRIKNPEIVSTTKSLCGTIRSQGCHAAGIVVSSRPLTDVCVVEKRSGSDVCNWDKRECENFGLIKIDALGLSTLSVLSRASDLIENRTGVRVDFNEIDLEDERVLKLFQDGKTTGVFQFEGKQMRQLLMSVNPKNFRGVTDCTALYRPGSLESGQTEKYVSIARGEEYEKYAFPELEPILKDTHGVMVFQEQIMQIFNKIGGFTWAEANKMRKIIGKKLGPGEFEKHRDHFVSG
ncbi:MAG: DNA polymerase III subunit alpha, partial [Epsilonproteobacteria bacterium]|nr:DNA polymerase III subunit alpha [Campylobacterota bacterium]